MIHLTAIG